MTEEQIRAIQNAHLPSWGRINRARLQAVLRYAGKNVLDVGCSTGAYVRYLRAQNYQAFGVDLLSVKEWEPGTFIKADASQLPFETRSFDTITAFEVVEHVPNPSRALQEFRRLSRKNIILSVPDCDTEPDLLRAGLTYTHWMDRTHCNFFTNDSLSQLLEQNGFRIINLEKINRIFPDYPVLRSYFIPATIAFPVSRLLAHLPFRRKDFMTLLVVAEVATPEIM